MFRLLLLVAVMAAPLAARDSSNAIPAAEPAADCHSSHHKVPSPAPPSHNCCKIAHDPAILPLTLPLQPPLVHTCDAVIDMDSPSGFLTGPLRDAYVQPGDPPLTTPLLI